MFCGELFWSKTEKGMNKKSPHKFKWRIFAAGMISIIGGYLLLAAADITISPILLVLGYCILLPLSFL